eukprot:7748142-Pyramimonas_sp.AAC.1
MPSSGPDPLASHDPWKARGKGVTNLGAPPRRDLASPARGRAAARPPDASSAASGSTATAAPSAQSIDDLLASFK